MNRSLENIFACGLAMQLPFAFVWMSILIDRLAHARSHGTELFALGFISFYLACAGFLLATAVFFASLFEKRDGRRGMRWVTWVYLLTIVVWVGLYASVIATERTS